MLKRFQVVKKNSAYSHWSNIRVSLSHHRHANRTLHSALHQFPRQNPTRQRIFSAMLRRAEHLLTREVQGVVGCRAEQLRRRSYGFILGIN